MFDTYITKSGGSTHSSVTVTEKKAPTDESLKLLEEMRNKTVTKVLATLKVEGTLVRGKVFIFQLPSHLQYEVVTIVNINGKEIENRHNVDRVKLGNLQVPRELLVKDWANAVVGDLFQQALEQDSDDFSMTMSDLLNPKGD